MITARVMLPLQLKERLYSVLIFTIISLLFGAVIGLKTGFKTVGVFASLLLWMNMMFFSCWVLGCSRRTMEYLILWQGTLALVWTTVIPTMLVFRSIPGESLHLWFLASLLGFPMLILAIVAGILTEER